jgi:hypothetical protein
MEGKKVFNGFFFDAEFRTGETSWSINGLAPEITAFFAREANPLPSLNEGENLENQYVFIPLK